MSKIVIFSGYARSGKTTALMPLLEEQGYVCKSSSAALHDFTAKLLASLFNAEPGFLDTSDKSSTCLTFMFTHNFNTRSRTFRLVRNLLIDIAENCLVAVFGREIFAMYMLKQIKQAIADGKNIAIETVGGEEFEILWANMSATERSATQLINLRRPESEEQGVDLRKLLPDGKELINDSTITELSSKLQLILN